MTSVKHLLVYFVVCYFSIQLILAQEVREDYRNSVATDVYVTKDTLTIHQIIGQHQTLFYSTDSLTIKRENFFWFRLDFSNEKDRLLDSDTIYIVTGPLDKGELFYGDSIVTSVYVDYTVRSGRYRRKGPTTPTIPVPVNALIEGRYVFLKIIYFRGIPIIRQSAFRYNTQSGEWINQNFLSIPAITSQLPIFILVGIAGLLAIFNLILYFFTRERQYLFYISFLVFQVIFYSRGSSLFSYYLFRGDYYLSFVSTEMAQVAANLSYVLFVKYFLETRTTLPTLDKVLKIISVALIMLIVIDTILLLIDPFFEFQSQIMYTQRYFMGVFAIVGVMYLVFGATGNLRYFVIAGTVAYAGGALSTMFLGKLNYMINGSAIENIIFAIGLSYKIRSISKAKLKSEQETNQVRISALRAQMNPHFIFNSLNSIQHLISKGDRIGALKYLSKFSTLLRQILESSIHVNVSIKEEIDLLRIYLELESFRFDQSFQYQIVVDKSLDTENMEVPILLLQPYVENAIAHGLLPKQHGPKELTISFIDDPDFIKCTISDTGIGRKASMELKKNLKIERPSRGLELSRQRLRLINEKYNLESLIQIRDSDEGTTVEIKIPKN
jgi:two-component sensor histidine kinase